MLLSNSNSYSNVTRLHNNYPKSFVIHLSITFTIFVTKYSVKVTMYLENEAEITNQRSKYYLHKSYILV